MAEKKRRGFTIGTPRNSGKPKPQADAPTTEKASYSGNIMMSLETNLDFLVVY